MLLTLLILSQFHLLLTRVPYAWQFLKLIDKVVTSSTVFLQASKPERRKHLPSVVLFSMSWQQRKSCIMHKCWFLLLK